VEKKYDIIISGHSHKPLIKKENGILYFNPGSAGKRRFNLPVSVGKIKIIDDKLSAKINELTV
jgi:predicted phosphodiesterase